LNPRQQLLRLIERVYAAPGSATGWSAFLKDISDTLGGSGASFISHDLENARTSVLTPAESQLAQWLARGASLAEAAGYLRLSVETVRKRLKGIFEKTATSRQPDLISLLVSIGRLNRRLPGNADIP
jgi:DNA-binding CsgD family transcriptional regulator